MKIKQQPIARTAVSIAAALLAMQMSAMAQTAPAVKTDGATLNLEEIVITASPTGRSKMKSSDSVSTVGQEQIARGGAVNTAEILRAIPGLRSESSGGEGNANVTVRGAPVSAGGGRYVQFQEDGLPVLLFGDIAFGTSDQFLRTDYTTDRLEVVRGGGASTMTSNAPGAVLNFISKNGRDVGNAVGITTGLGSKLNRVDFNYGTGLGDSAYVNLGGFVRQGEGGAAKTGFTAEEGGQFKASLTKEFDKGYVRLSVKHLDDKTPSFMPVPTKMDANGNISAVAGVDPRKSFYINSGLSRDVTFGKDGNTITSNPTDGLHVVSNSIGLEAKVDIGGGWTLEEKFRKSANSGRFIAMFPADNGNAVANNFTGTLFNTSLDDLGNMFNDVKLSKSFQVGEGKAQATFGVFNGTQNVAQTWFWNQYNVNLNNGAVSGPVNTGWNTWGGCCVRNWDVQYTVTAPYAAVSWENGPVTVDASVRSNNQKASGYTIAGTKTGTGDTASSGVWDASTQKTINYNMSKTSYSLGGNYAIDKDTSVYARLSDGFNFSADRLLYGTALDGSSPVSFNELKQQEIGLKMRRGNFNAFTTLFFAQTKESNYEATTQKFTSNSYKAKGLEVELGYKMDNFRINGGVTLTNASIASSLNASEIGKTPRRQAKLIYAITPSYKAGDFEVGAAFVGTTDSFGDDANKIKLKGYVVTNMFVNYQFNKQVSASLSANNLFNTIGYTEVEGDGHAARSVAGRSVKASVKIAF